jgi:hypothetical protein
MWITFDVKRQKRHRFCDAVFVDEYTFFEVGSLFLKIYENFIKGYYNYISLLLICQGQTPAFRKKQGLQEGKVIQNS